MSRGDIAQQIRINIAAPIAILMRTRRILTFSNSSIFASIPSCIESSCKSLEGLSSVCWLLPPGLSARSTFGADEGASGVRSPRASAEGDRNPSGEARRRTDASCAISCIALKSAFCSSSSSSSSERAPAPRLLGGILAENTTTKDPTSRCLGPIPVHAAVVLQLTKLAARPYCRKPFPPQRDCGKKVASAAEADTVLRTERGPESIALMYRRALLPV